MKEIRLRTAEKEQVVDITEQVQEVVRQAGISEGFICIYVPHTSAAVSIHRRMDMSERPKLDAMLDNINPDPKSSEYTKAALVAPTEVALFKDGKLLMDEDQHIFFYEFDGPKERRVYVYVSP